MREFKPEPFMMQVGRLEHNLALFYKDGWNETRRAEFIKHFRELHGLELKYGLRVSASYMDEIVERLKTLDGDGTFLDEAVTVCRRVLNQELAQLCYFEIPPHQLPLWTAIEPFGEIVAKRFPDCRDDIEEAAKCLALDRGSACVYHLMCSIDLALQDYCKKVKAKYNPKGDWNRLIEEIKKRIDKMPSNTKARLVKKEKHLSIYAHLHSVRLAWRNPSMHSRRPYQPSEAMEVYNATNGLMNDIAKVI